MLSVIVPVPIANATQTTTPVQQPQYNLTIPGGDVAVVTSVADVKQLANMLKRDIKDRISELMLDRNIKPVSSTLNRRVILRGYNQLSERATIFSNTVNRARKEKLKSLVETIRSMFEIYDMMLKAEQKWRVQLFSEKA